MDTALPAQSFTCNHTCRSSAISHTHIFSPHTLIGHHSPRGSFRPELRQMLWSHSAPHTPTVTTRAHTHTHIPPLSLSLVHAVGHAYTHADSETPPHSRGALQSCASTTHSTPMTADGVVSTCSALSAGLKTDTTRHQGICLQGDRRLGLIRIVTKQGLKSWKKSKLRVLWRPHSLGSPKSLPVKWHLPQAPKSPCQRLSP